MRDLSAQTGIGTDAGFLNGNLVDDQTEINEGINQDLVQFFQKLAALAALAPNGLPDNETNGYQLITALEAVARSFAATTLLQGTVEKATTAEAQNGTANKFLDAALLQTVTATTDRLGIVEKATPAEAQAGTADKFLDAALLQTVTATIDRKGIAELLTQAEANTATDDERILTALKAKAALLEWTPVFESLTLNSGWTGIFFYRKNALGQLEIDAALTRGSTGGASPCTLPVGFRPGVAVTQFMFGDLNPLFDGYAIIATSGVITTAFTQDLSYSFSIVIPQS